MGLIEHELFGGIDMQWRILRRMVAQYKANDENVPPQIQLRFEDVKQQRNDAVKLLRSWKRSLDPRDKERANEIDRWIRCFRS